MSVFCRIDEKYIPLYRIMWVSALPHFCGEANCQREGQYEIRLEQGEAVWGSQQEGDAALAALEAWQGGSELPNEDWEE